MCVHKIRVERSTPVSVGSIGVWGYEKSKCLLPAVHTETDSAHGNLIKLSPYSPF